MRMELINGRYVFTGDAVPMELARKSWSDKYRAVRAAESVGLICMANGAVIEDEPVQRECGECGGRGFTIGDGFSEDTNI